MPSHREEPYQYTHEGVRFSVTYRAEEAAMRRPAYRWCVPMDEAELEGMRYCGKGHGSEKTAEAAIVAAQRCIETRKELGR